MANTVHGRIIASAAIAVGFLSAPDALAQSEITTSSLEAPKRQIAKMIGGTIRNDGAGWALIRDSQHMPLGIASVSQTPTEITITYDFKATQVVTLAVVPDETFAVQGVICGASVGLSSAFIRCSLAGKPGAIVNPASLTAPLGNLWIMGHFLAE